MHRTFEGWYIVVKQKKYDLCDRLTTTIRDDNHDRIGPAHKIISTMNMRNCILLLLLLLLPVVNRAQETHMVAKKRILFSDDFKQDSPGQFPNKWRLLYCHETISGKYPTRDYWRVGNEDGLPYLASDKILRLVAPMMEQKNYLPDSFTIEFDFLVPDAKSCAEIFFGPRSSNIDSCKRVSFHVLKGGIHFAAASNIHPDMAGKYPGEFDYKTWHHFEFSYHARKLDGYLDGHHLLAMNDCKFVPGSFSLGCVPPIKFSNVVAYTIDYVPVVMPMPSIIPPDRELDKIITENKIVTYDIHFDVNKSTVKKESMPFINDLAAWMKANDTVKLRIDGHTDSDGRVPMNVKLSRDRAEAVRTLLIEAGVAPGRISTEGFGPNKPIASNKTMDGKAKNRRVEFLKM